LLQHTGVRQLPDEAVGSGVCHAWVSFDLAHGKDWLLE
jgi:hypothetical protein